jgi:hypothetical protein
MTELMTIFIPVFSIWRWSAWGVLIGPLVTQAAVTFWDILEFELFSSRIEQEYFFNADYWEFWRLSFFIIFLYCVGLLVMKFLFVYVKRLLR